MLVIIAKIKIMISFYIVNILSRPVIVIGSIRKDLTVFKYHFNQGKSRKIYWGR